MTFEPTEIRTIQLKNNSILEVSMTQQFIDKMKEKFDIKDDKDITDDMVRLFVYSSVDTAVSKAEKQSMFNSAD